MRSVENRTSLISRRTFLAGSGLAGIGAGLAGTHTGRELVKAGLGRLGIVDKKEQKAEKTPPINRELPSFPDFQLPDRNQRVIVIPMYRSGVEKPSPSVTIKWLLESVRDSWKNDSYGQIEFDFKLQSWQGIDAVEENGNLNDKVASAGDSILEHSDIEDLDQYQTRLYISHANGFTGGFGSKRWPSNYNQVWIYTTPGGLNFGDPWGFMGSATKHELGHALGLTHSNSRDTNGVVKEYGSLSDTMGQANWTFESIGAPQRVLLGCLGKEQTQPISRDGIYTIRPLDTTSETEVDVPRILRIQKPDTDERYYISARFASGLGLILEVHVWNERAGTAPNRIILPKDTTNPLDNGEVFWDPKNGIRIEQIASVPTQEMYGPRIGPKQGQKTLKITFDK